MRKKILGIAVMAVVAVAAAWNINQSENEIKLSDLALDNVEALASGEGGSGYCSYSGGGCNLAALLSGSIGNVSCPAE